MKKKIFIYIVLPYLLFLSTSLVWHVTHMDKSDLMWISHYDVGNCEFFISQYGNIDALVVKKKDIWNSYKPFNNSIGYHDYIAGGYVDYIIYHKHDTITGSWVITKEFQSRPVYAYFSLDDRFNKDSGLGNFYITPTTQSALINKTIVKDCFVANDKNSQLKVPQNYHVKGFVWSKSKGFLQYSFLNGEVFTRIEYTDFGKEAGLNIYK